MNQQNEWNLGDLEIESLLGFFAEPRPLDSGDHLMDEELDVYALGACSAWALERLDLHLAACDGCARRVERRIAIAEEAVRVARILTAPIIYRRTARPPVNFVLPGPSIRRPGNLWVENWRAGIEPEESFRQIFFQYYRLVLSFFLKKGFSAEESHDLAQEAFVKVSRSLDSLRRESRFETWLFQICANVYRNALRAQSAARKQVVVLRVDRDLKYREITELLRVSIETVKAHLFKVRRLLKMKLTEYFASARR
jgi:DNA-directed RNA polymerase specialized sigma24 family protein